MSDGSPDPRFTDKQRRFVHEYLIDHNASAAAIRAGFKPDYANRQAWQMLGMPHIQEAVKQGMEAMVERVAVTVEMIVADLYYNARLAREAKSFAESNRALELIGKHLAMFPDKLTVDFRDVATLTDEELAERRSKLKLMA